ncbi:MAG TPA: hypothetical protein VKU86_10870 [Acidimicrobiales bacterium]|nr:hypothetical protein [Acidimicrobiales bacterium]
MTAGETRAIEAGSQGLGAEVEGRGKTVVNHRCRDYCFRCDLLRFLRAVLSNMAAKPPSAA